MRDLEPVDVEFARTASHVVRVERIIDASPEAIWMPLVETSTWTEWFPTMTRAESVSQRATLGSTRTVKVGSLVAEELVVVADAHTRWGFTVVRTNLPIAKRMLEIVELEDVSDAERTRSRVGYTGAFEPLWFNRPLYALVTRRVAASWRHALDGLASHVAA